MKHRMLYGLLVCVIMIVTFTGCASQQQEKPAKTEADVLYEEDGNTTMVITDTEGAYHEKDHHNSEHHEDEHH